MTKDLALCVKGGDIKAVKREDYLNTVEFMDAIVATFEKNWK